MRETCEELWRWTTKKAISFLIEGWDKGESIIECWDKIESTNAIEELAHTVRINYFLFIFYDLEFVMLCGVLVEMNCYNCRDFSVTMKCDVVEMNRYDFGIFNVTILGFFVQLKLKWIFVFLKC